MCWQIVWCWGNEDFSDRMLYVGRQMMPGESIKRPPPEMLRQLTICKTRAINP